MLRVGHDEVQLEQLALYHAMTLSAEQSLLMVRRVRGDGVRRCGRKESGEWSGSRGWQQQSDCPR